MQAPVGSTPPEAQRPRTSSIPASVPALVPASLPASLPTAIPAPASPFGDDAPATSLPIIARRPWGLIIALLVIDLGLATAGAWMLFQGLADKPSAGAESK